MPNSLRCKIRSQMHKGLLSEKDGQRLLDALDIADASCVKCKHYFQYYCGKSIYWCARVPPWTKCNEFEKRGEEND